MSTGVSLQLFDGATPRANLTGIQALWWDVTEPKDADCVVGKSTSVSTDANGYIKLDLSKVTDLTLGQSGFLTLYKLDVEDERDSLVFSGKVATSDVIGGVDMYFYDSGWTRPAAWLPLPVLTGAEQKVVGLCAVFQDSTSNFLGLNCEGAYTVDWGDGVIENFATGVPAYHQYSYSSPALVGTELTSEAVTFRQAIVTVVPQAGNSLTRVNFDVRDEMGWGVVDHFFSTGWLDLAVSSSSLTSLSVASYGFMDGYRNRVVDHSNLEQFSLIGSNGVTNFDCLFRYCQGLRSIPVMNTSSGTSFSEMFSGCSGILTVPHMSTSAGTSFEQMFYGCYALESVPRLDTSAGVNFRLMFQDCGSLKSIPHLNTSLGTNFQNMFANCRSIQALPLLNTSSGTRFSDMMRDCIALRFIPPLNTSNGLFFDYMFNRCESIKSIPLLDTSAGIALEGMFFACAGLVSAPPLNVSACVSFDGMFFGCSNLLRGTLTGVSKSISYVNTRLSSAALNDIYSNLAVVDPMGGVDGPYTIEVYNAWGAGGDDPSIATAKGWTVLG